MYEISETESCRRVRYAKLRYTIRYLQDGEVPMDKESALRGGMGQMLLSQHCIQAHLRRSGKPCEECCSFCPDCLVQKIMYAKFQITPPYVTKESLGFVLHCPDKRTYVQAGDETEFVLTIFGNTLLYFSQFLYALHALGQNGLGKAHVPFAIAGIHNSEGDSILADGDIRMDRYNVEFLDQYVEKRYGQILQEAHEADAFSLEQGVCIQLEFVSPITTKFCSEQVRTFDETTAPGVVNAICRRIHMLQLYEGILEEEERYYLGEDYEFLSGKGKAVCVTRHSSTKDSRIRMYGVKGYLTLQVYDPELLKILAAGELAHVGKNTRFGFGVYRIRVV